MKIRKAKKEDISNLRKLILCCINKYFKKYPKKKIIAMKEYSSEKRLKQYLKKWEVFVLVDHDKIKGTISLENNKIIFSLYAINQKTKDELISFVEKRSIKKKSKKLIAIVMPENEKDFLLKNFNLVERIILAFGEIKFNELKMEKKFKLK